jgi:hypothetical protein
VFEQIRDKIEGIRDVFNKKAVRRGMLGVVLVGAVSMGGNLFMGYLDAPRSASSGPQADIRPVLVEAARQQATLKEWNENWQSICHIAGQPDVAGSTPAVNKARDFLQKMAQEELVGAQAVKVLEQLGTAICINQSPKARNAIFIDATNTLTVSSRLAGNRQLFHVLEESRHAVQQSQGMMGSINTTFEETLRASFALEADASATAILAASRLRAKGDFSLWEMLSHDLTYIDLKTTFLGEMLKHGDEMKATRAVFDAWYDNPMRLREVYDQVRVRLQNEKHWPVERPYFEKLPSNFFDKLGELGDGSNYGANKSPNINKHFKPGA